MSIKDLTPETLRQFIQDRHEKEYALIDVRQPGEYERGHIPGARLFPLPDLFRTMGSLPADKPLVFYCHSGARSMVAASMVQEEGMGSRGLYNLHGGMLSWDGGVVEDYPRVQMFKPQTAPSEMLKTAMNMEKGALVYYTYISENYEDQPWVKVFSNLAKAELGHARTVYRFWRQIETRGEEFEPLFEKLSGEVLEGGMTLRKALKKAAAVKKRKCLHLIELALKIEYAAFDLYHTMADRITASDAQEAFITIAQEEKAHMRSLARAIDTCSP